MSLSHPARAPTRTAGSRAETPWIRVGAARTISFGDRAEFALASAGLFICTGVPEAVFPDEFRFVKHAFYACIMGLLLLRWQASLRAAARDLLLCGFGALLVSSALWSEQPAWAFKRGAVMLQTTLFGLYLASRFSLEELLRALSYALLLLLAALAASALLDPTSAFASPDHPGAFRGPLVHKNHLALLMALTIPALLLQIRGTPARRVLFGIAVASAVLFLTLSRSLGGMLVASMLFSVVAIHRVARPARKWLLLLPTLAVALGAIAAAAGLVDRILVAVGKDPTLTGRIEIWEATWLLIRERPLLGHSIASFWQMKLIALTGFWFSNAHNGYLQLLIDLGLIGFATFVTQLVWTLARSLSLARRPEPAALWPYCIAALMLAYNLVEVSIVEENSIVWVLYVSASFAVRGPVSRRQQVPVHPSPLRIWRVDPA